MRASPARSGCSTCAKEQIEYPGHEPVLRDARLPEEEPSSSDRGGVAPTNYVNFVGMSDLARAISMP
eukprot:7412421-Heterocapsa_arctica.AAC.1